jgi:hypothetical protein
MRRNSLSGPVVVAMRGRRESVSDKPQSRIVEVWLPRDPKPEFRQLGGSDSDHFNQTLADQTLSALWVAQSGDEQRNRQYLVASAALVGAAPRDELEGMLVSQMIACHAASLECHRRAMLAEQTVEGRQVNLGAAAKLSRTYVALLEGLNRHRGKGRQVVRVEHVTVQAGGRAIVGAVAQGSGGHGESEDRAHAQPASTRKYAATTRGRDPTEERLHARPALAHAPEPALRCPDAGREPVPVAGGERQAALPDARRGRR